MASCLLLFYSTSLYAIYGGTDGGANEEATSQFYSRAICSKLNPTFAVKFIINLNLRLCNYYKLSPTMFHSVWCQIPWHGGFIPNYKTIPELAFAGAFAVGVGSIACLSWAFLGVSLQKVYMRCFKAINMILGLFLIYCALTIIRG